MVIVRHEKRLDPRIIDRIDMTQKGVVVGKIRAIKLAMARDIARIRQFMTQSEDHG